MFIRRTVWPQLTIVTHLLTYLLTFNQLMAIASHFRNDLLKNALNKLYI
jgi:hypothetical protein